MKKLYIPILAMAIAAGACNKSKTEVTPAITNAAVSGSAGEYKMLTFSGRSGSTDEGSYVRLNWTAQNEHQMHHYVVERATEGENWHVLEEMPCSAKSKEVSRWYADEQLRTNDGDMFRYRVRVFDANDKSISSRHLNVKFGKHAAAVIE